MRIFITGGAGFIGCNLAAHHLQRKDEVIIFDNLSRARTHHNLEWLQQQGPIQFIRGDIRHADELQVAMQSATPDLVVHLAGQVAVTTSVQNPRDDFENNALGTFNVLEAARQLKQPPAVFYASTNKVYGEMKSIPIVLDGTRYRYRDLPHGINESQPLDFHSPYGCSKGTGDQYVLDYARIYGLRTVVFRQSCIYGQRQFGIEDQGWVAHFLIAVANHRPLTIYGDGNQVRDLLNVKDLIAAYQSAWENIENVKGQVFNVGGGAGNTLSIWSEFGPLLEKLAGRPIPITHADWRPGDQLIFVSDNSKAKQWLGWEPRISIEHGIRELWDWIIANPQLFIF
jgi:CDP-paratose 2-epimerase